MKKNTLFKNITRSILAFILIVIISITTTIYEIYKLSIIYFRIKFVFKDINIKIKEKVNVIKIILRYFFINDISINRKSICIIKKENYNYEVVLNNQYFMIINLNSKSVIKCVENKKED